MVKPSQVFTVVPTLPEPLKPLNELAYNLRWTWNHETVALFERLDPTLWEATNHNPVLLLRTVDQTRLDQAAADEEYVRLLDNSLAELSTYLDGTQVEEPALTHEAGRVGYFSAEFGLAECLPIYAGGLGILAGDHLKSASDLGLSVTGVGLFYRGGYFQQRLTADGWQEEHYPNHDPAMLPIRPVLDVSGRPLEVRLALPGRELVARVWQAQVGRVPLYLMDSDVEGNTPGDRTLTHRLYGGDRDTRIRQELLLGIGGVRLLDALGRRPDVCHLNEGHSAFLTLERIRQCMVEHGLTFAEARTLAAGGHVFTTHTPVAAGHDAFDQAVIDHYLGDYCRQLGLSLGEFMALGRQNPGDQTEPFSLTILALRLSARSNGVSRLHGGVSRRIWGGVWPGLSEDEVPIGHVTNGVHVRSWLAPELADLHEAATHEMHTSSSADPQPVNAIAELPAAQLWERHERLRAGLVRFVRARLVSQLERQGAGPYELEHAAAALDPQALTIGFARRFAEYKRGTLLLRDVERLVRLLNLAGRPVQLIFAGKAHPSDNGGKELIRQVFQVNRRHELRGKIVLLEEYDLGVARRMIQGVDVWLNTPRRPMEASATSGMKAVINGVLHASTLDGWWDEGFRPDLGWAIGDRRALLDAGVQDELESNAAFELLESEIIPLFYDRDEDGLPRGWIARMWASMSTLPPIFSSDRMVTEYATRFYGPAAREIRRQREQGPLLARELSTWLSRIEPLWSEVRIASVRALPPEIPSGSAFDLEAEVFLGALKPNEVSVHAALGALNGKGVLEEPALVQLQAESEVASGCYRFALRGVRRQPSGRHGYAVRVTPKHPTQPLPFPLGLVRWSD